MVTTGTEASEEGTDLVPRQLPNSEPEVYDAHDEMRKKLPLASHTTVTMTSEPMRFESGSFRFEDQDLLTSAQDLDLLNKLEEYRDLSEGWDGYGASPIPDEIINIAEGLAVQPEIARRCPEVFPTGRETVQFEFISANGDEAELEIYGQDEVTLLVDFEDGDIFERSTSLQDSVALLDDLLT